MSTGDDDSEGGGNDTTVSQAPSRDSSSGSGLTPSPSTPPGDPSHDNGDCGPLLDLGKLGSLASGLIDIDIGAGSGDGTHAAALIDVDLGGADASISLLGGIDVAGGNGLLCGLDSLGTSCLLDGIVGDCGLI